MTETAHSRTANMTVSLGDNTYMFAGKTAPETFASTRFRGCLHQMIYETLPAPTLHVTTAAKDNLVSDTTFITETHFAIVLTGMIFRFGIGCVTRMTVIVSAEETSYGTYDMAMIINTV